MTQKIRLLFLLLSTTVQFSCKKVATTEVLDNYPFNLNANCTESFPEDLPGGFIPNYRFVSKGPELEYATFNPRNPDEILYCKMNNSGNSFYQLLIYNRVTKTERLLTESFLSSPPKWSRNGWILLTAGMIYKIKENGDSLQALTPGYAAEWNYDGSKVAIDVFDGNIKKYIGVVYDVQTHEKDTLPFMLAIQMNWQNPDNLLLYYSSEFVSNGFNILDMNEQKRTKIMDIESPLGLCWINSKEFVYIHSGTFFKCSITDFTVTKLGKFCSNDIAVFMSYSEVSNELISLVEQHIYLDDAIIQTEDKLMVFNFNDHSVLYIKL